MRSPIEVDSQLEYSPTCEYNYPRQETMTIHDTILRRRSIRSYSGRHCEPELVNKIEKLIVHPGAVPPFGSRIRFTLIDLSGMPEEWRSSLGTYGFIRGARLFAAGIVTVTEKSVAADTANRRRNIENSSKGSSVPQKMTDLGYTFEHIILQLTNLGLGTCWLGGTFQRGKLSEYLNLPDNEIIPAITPVGYPAERRRPAARFIRFAAGSKRRKPWEKLFFVTCSSVPLKPLQPSEVSEKTKIILECVRLAPSASNKQPWRLIITFRGSGKAENLVHFFLQRDRAYGLFRKHIDLQRIDTGIAMYHFEAAAAEKGITGTWTYDPGTGGSVRPPRGNVWEYIVSWRGEYSFDS